MAASQNGWRANDRSVVSSRLVPGTDVKLTVRNGAPGDLLLEVAARFDREVEDIDNARSGLDDWGYAERVVRGGSDLSNHASGTAIDLNAPRHPLGTDPSANFTSRQIATIRGILSGINGVVRWGGDYSGRKDGMHFELNDGTDNEDCVRALAAIRGMPVGTPQPNHPASVGTLRVGSRGPAVEKLQRVLATWYPYLNLQIDGDFGPATEKAVRELQRRAGLVIDGIAGPATLGVLGLS